MGKEVAYKYLLLGLVLFSVGHSVNTAPAAPPAFDLDQWQAGIDQSSDGIAVSLEGTCFESYWEELPSIVLARDDADDRRILAVDSYSFRGRMAALKFLMFDIDPAALWETTSAFSSSSSSPSSCREWHWLWSYAAQLDWQQRSGRLSMNGSSNNNNMEEDRISYERSWFGYMNFHFSVAILLGLEKSGMLLENNNETIVVQLDSIGKNLVASDDAVQKSIETWSRFFKGGYSNYKRAILSTDHCENGALSKEFKKQRFLLQKEMWKAHVEVIHNTQNSELASALLAQLPSAERDFGRGWADMVEILAASVFPTDLVSLRRDGGGFLPTEVLHDDRWAQLLQNKDNLVGAEKRRFTSVVATHDLIAMPESSRRTAVAFWKRVSRSFEISRTMPGTVIQLFHGTPLAKVRQMIRVMGLFVMRPREWVALAAGVVGAMLVGMIVS